MEYNTIEESIKVNNTNHDFIKANKIIQKDKT